jgi:hypothetical protein
MCCGAADHDKQPGPVLVRSVSGVTGMASLARSAITVIVGLGYAGIRWDV